MIAREVLEVTPPRRLRVSWADAAYADAARTEVSWTLAAEGTGTRVLLEHSGFDPDDPTHSSPAASWAAAGTAACGARSRRYSTPDRRRMTYPTPSRACDLRV